MKNKPLPTSAYLHTVASYSPATGVFRWKIRPKDHFKNEATCRRWNSRFSGKEIRTTSTHGYIRFAIDYKLYLAHRVAFALMTGEWPSCELDHINHDKLDNRWSNLRPVSRSKQMQNTSLNKNNTSGVNGVSWCNQRKKWIATITVNRKQMNLGGFLVKRDAIAARKSADRKYRFHENHGSQPQYLLSKYL